jgi:hypothetical protein
VWGIIFAAAIKLRFESLAGRHEEKIAHTTKNLSTSSTPLPELLLVFAILEPWETPQKKSI